MFEGLLLPWKQIYHLAFYSIFRTTPEVPSKLYFVEICQVSEKLWLFNHKRADFWLPILDSKNHFSASLRSLFVFHEIMLITDALKKNAHRQNKQTNNSTRQVNPFNINSIEIIKIKQNQVIKFDTSTAIVRRKDQSIFNFMFCLAIAELN